jgi:radical SAM protein with 4Fe4S-binding SPASM domain
LEVNACGPLFVSLLQQILPRTKSLRVRPPDHVEQREELFLQVWGNEGYWQVVDGEFRELLRSAEQATTLEEILAAHPEWQPHRRSIRTQLGNLRKAGVLGHFQKRSPAPAIENVTINLVTACNLACRTCYVPQEIRTATRLDTRQLQRFLEDLRPCLGAHATLSLLGGEPFLHPEGVLEIGRWARRHKMSCNVSTNGTVLSDALLEGLAETGLKVQVSLDGANAATNDAIRGAGTFQKATAAVRRLAGRKIPATLCMVCCAENLPEIPAYFQLARSLGATEVRFIPLKRLGNGGAGTLTPAPQLDIVKAICRELDAHAEFQPLCRSDLYSIIRSMLRESSRRPTCGSGTQTLLVQSDGSVYPCINTTMPSLKLGSISDGRRPILERGRDFGNSLSVEAPSHPCHDCFVKRWCLAGCPGETLQQAGSLTRRHWNCDDLQRTITFVMWRLAAENQASTQNVPRTLI